MLIPPLAVFFLWRTVLGEGTTLGTYFLSTMVMYYIVTSFFVANTPFSAWITIGESIRDDSLAAWLVRPTSHYGIFLGRLLGFLVPFWLMGYLVNLVAFWTERATGTLVAFWPNPNSLAARTDQVPRRWWINMVVRTVKIILTMLKLRLKWELVFHMDAILDARC